MPASEDQFSGRRLFDDELFAAMLSELEANGIDPDDPRVEEIVAGAVTSALPRMGKELITALRRTQVSMHCDREALRRGFERRLAKRWRGAFDLLRLVTSGCYEVGDIIRREFSDEAVAADDVLFEALTRIHARACQTAAEVESLIRAGFANGAQTRWRTLHELAVVAIFLQEHGGQVAEQYLLHDAIQSRRVALQYREYQEQLGLEPICDEEMEQLEATRAQLIERFGQPYGTDYGWAASTLDLERPTFAQVEKSIGLDRMRPHFKMASHGVHAGPKGLYFNLSHGPEPPPILLTGPSNTGFADPGHATAISLVQVTATLIAEYTTLEGLVYISALHQLSEDVGESLLATQREVEALASKEIRWWAGARPRIEYWVDYTWCRLLRLLRRGRETA